VSDDSEVHARGGGDATRSPVSVDEYTWEDFMREHGFEHESAAASHSSGGRSGGLVGRLLRYRDNGDTSGTGIDWSSLEFDPTVYLGFRPDEVDEHVGHGKGRARAVLEYLNEWLRTGPVTKGRYNWESFKLEYYYDDRGLPPRDEEGGVVPFDPAEYLGFPPEQIEARLAAAKHRASELRAVEDSRTVDVNPDLDEDAFFSTEDGHTTLVNRYDLEKSVPMDRKRHFTEVERYWVDQPNAFIIVFHSTKENEKKYYVVTPHMNDMEEDLQQFLTRKLRTTIMYSDEVVVQGTPGEREAVIEREVWRLLDRYDLYVDPGDRDRGLVDRLRDVLGNGSVPSETESGRLDGIEARPEPVVLDEDLERLNGYQVAKLQYFLARNFVGYERIDAIKHDVNVEDISCDGYESPVFVYHSEYEQLITNITHGETQLDNFVVKLAQRSGKSISKRHPQVDASLPDGSRAQLTLGNEVSAHGTNYTIRQFKDVPFTPIDLINWRTFSLEEMVYLWLCIENNKSLLFAGGTASGKTTSLNAVSLFIPSNAKIVSIEDTREVELPQRNWVASVTRPSFSHGGEGDVDEFDLLEAALRQRPEYILMGEVRGEEGRTLFQVMSTGHTTLTTFHADSVEEVLKRFTTDPINVSKTMFTALDIVSVQTQTRIQGEKVRRNKTITEINRYSTEKDEINVKDVHNWRAEGDEFRSVADSRLLEEVKFDRGWSGERLDTELFKRRVVLSYLIDNDIKEYAKVAATLQGFINDPDTILALIARDRLADSLDDLRGMESVLIDIDPEKEALVPRPDSDARTQEEAEAVLEEAEERLFEEYRQMVPSPLVEALPDLDTEGTIEVTGALPSGPGLPALPSGGGNEAGGAARIDRAADGGIDTEHDRTE